MKTFASNAKQTQKMSLKFSILAMAVVLSSQVYASVPVDFSQLVEQATPAVVSVTASKTRSQQEMLDDIPEILKRFFGHQIIIPQQETEQKTGYGSAFFISQDGYLLTNRHVVDGASKVTITMNDRRELDAEVVGSDERTDVALLKVKGSQFPTLKLGNADQLKVGQPVLAIGSPFGFDYSASSGIVSAKSRAMPVETAVPFIQTDVPLNPGNSGGPLFNAQGEVVGINSRIFSGTGGYMGLSFSIPIDVAMNVADQLKTTGQVIRPYLGVTLQEMDRTLAEAYGLNRPEGAIITQIATNSPAERAGLQVGDVILSYDGQALTRTSDLIRLVNASKVDQKVNLHILRQQQRKNVSLTLLATPKNTAKKQDSRSLQDTKANPENHLGVALRELSANEKARYRIDGVLVQRLNYSGLLAKAGVQEYDVIRQIGQTQIRSLADFQTAIEQLKSPSTVAIQVYRQGRVHILGLKYQR